MPEAQPLAPRSPDQTAPALYGLIRLGGMSVALPAAAIREVVPRPEELIAFPSLLAEVSGALALRGQMIPVLNLERLLNPQQTGNPVAGKIVVVLRHGSLIHGIEAESIEGVSALGEEALGLLEITASTPSHRLVKATFSHNGMAGIVIDPTALEQLSGLPMTHDDVGQDRNRQKPFEPTLIFRIGNLRYALPAACVDASLPSQKLLPAPVTDELWIAMLQHNGMEIPVVDTLALLQQGSLGHRTSGSAVVLRSRPQSPDGQDPFGLVALLIDSVEDIVRLEPEAVAALDGDLAEMPFVKGLVGMDCGPCLMLDGEHLESDPRLMKLGGVRQCPGKGQSEEPGADLANRPAGQAVDTAREPYLVFAVGGNSFAAPLTVIDEILLQDAALIPLGSPAHAVLGLLSRRGRTVPILNLAACLGETGSAPEKFLVIARIDCPGRPNRIGFAVDALRSVEKAAVQQLGTTRGARQSAPLGLLEFTIRLDDGKACSVLNLQELALNSLGDRLAA